MARMTLEEIRNRPSTVDRAKVEATTEAEIEAHRAADGDVGLNVPADARIIESPRALRVRLGLTQPEMASALNIPLGTWRNWEQGRVSLEPAAVALLRVVSHAPAAALAALAPTEGAIGKDAVPAGYDAPYGADHAWHVTPGHQGVLPPAVIRSSATGQYLTGRKAPSRSRPLRPKTA